MAGDPEALAPVVAAAARAKIGVVERDPGEAGDRRLLNFGHTLGHALESALGYRHLRHGEAVGYGMLFALRLAERRGLDPETAVRCRRLLERCLLPDLPRVEVDDLVAAMERDKKVRESGLVWILPAALGHGQIASDIEEREIRRELAEFLSHPRGC